MSELTTSGAANARPLMLRQLLLGAKLCDEQHFVEAAAQAEADGTHGL